MDGHRRLSLAVHGELIEALRAEAREPTEADYRTIGLALNAARNRQSGPVGARRVTYPTGSLATSIYHEKLYDQTRSRIGKSGHVRGQRIKHEE
jgi:hypothetical protein